MTLWDELVQALGRREDDEYFRDLIASLEEKAEVDEGPDPEYLPRKYYCFKNAGLEIGLRSGVVSHVFAFIEPHEGYSAYEGPLGENMSRPITGKIVKEMFGEPIDKGGGGTPNALIGFIYPWVKFKHESCELRFELNEHDQVRKVSVMMPNWSSL